MTLWAALTIFSVALYGACAEEAAEPAPTLGATLMQNFDTDGDGKVSLVEMLEHVNSAGSKAKKFKGWNDGFKEADKDGDLHLTVEELDHLFETTKKEHEDTFSNWLDSYSKTITEEWDANKDGKVSYMEMLDHMHKNPKEHMNLKAIGKVFKESDGDNDLELDATELKAFLTTIGKHAHGKHLNEDKRSLGEIALENFDKDGDGKVNLHEMLEAVPHGAADHPAMKGWTKGFKEADKDGDQHLTADELDNLLKDAMQSHSEDFGKWLDMYTHQVTQTWDEDKDGLISFHEFTQHMVKQQGHTQLTDHYVKMAKSFKDSDKDDDFKLTEPELRDFLTKIGKNSRMGRPLHHPHDDDKKSDL